jgi:hypothetical protein
MRESRTYGSVRGAGSNLRPYRDHKRHQQVAGSSQAWRAAVPGRLAQRRRPGGLPILALGFLLLHFCMT